MGIKHLNNFLTNTCKKETIAKTHLSMFSGKSVAVDASIYMYRFIGENKLVENIYSMISIFLNYNEPGSPTSFEVSKQAVCKRKL